MPSLAQQVYDAYSTNLLREDIYAVLPQALEGLKSDQVQDVLDGNPTLINLVIDNPAILATLGVILDPEFITLLEEDQEVRDMLGDTLVQSLLADVDAIDELIVLLAAGFNEGQVVAPVIAPIDNITRIQGYSEVTIQATLSSGTLPVTWSLTSSDGITINTSGRISIPVGLVVGMYSVTITAENSQQDTDTEDFTFTVEVSTTEAGSPVIAAIGNVSQQVSTPYETVATLSSDTESVTWSITGEGASIGETTGAILINVPSTPGTYDYRVTAVDPMVAGGNADTEDFSVTATGIPPVISEIVVGKRQEGYDAFGIQARLESGTLPVTWGIQSFIGVTISQAGVITIPADRRAGRYPITATAEIAGGVSDERLFHVVIVEPPTPEPEPEPEPEPTLTTEGEGRARILFMPIFASKIIYAQAFFLTNPGTSPLLAGETRSYPTKYLIGGDRRATDFNLLWYANQTDADAQQDRLTDTTRLPTVEFVPETPTGAAKVFQDGVAILTAPMANGYDAPRCGYRDDAGYRRFY